MSYAQNTALAPAGFGQLSGIEELSFNEIEAVDGGIAPLVAGLLIVGGIAAVAFVAGVVAGYFANS